MSGPIDGPGGPGGPGGLNGPNPHFKPLNSGWGIQPMGPAPNGKGDMHDTFNVDDKGNISGGHTTIQQPGGKKIHLPWDS